MNAPTVLDFFPLLVSAATLLAACGGETLGSLGSTVGLPTAGARSGTVDGGGPSCELDADCAAGELCSFAIGASCTMDTPVGQCIEVGPLCGMVAREAVGCGCDGQDVTWAWGCNGISDDYAPARLAHRGACADAGTPPAPCYADADCPSDLKCGFRVEQGCGTAGECIPEVDFGGLCACVGVPLCACDGTTEYVSCCVSYSSKSIASMGVCSADAGPP